MFVPHNPSAAADPLFQGMDLRDMVRLLRRRGRLIGGVTLACGAIGLLLALLMTPRYQAETIVMLDPRQTKVVDIGQVVSGLPSENAALRSEMDIIASRAVIDRVVKKRNLTDDAELNPPPFWGRKKGEPTEEEAARTLTAVAEAVGKRLKVANDGRSMSIRISFQSRDSKKAALIANSFADEYLVDQLEAKYEATARANTWLNERLGTLKQQVESAEKAVGDFRQKTKLIEIDGSTVAARQMEAINRQLTEARGQTSQAEARLRSAQAMLRSPQGLEGAADVLASPLIQRLREQEAEVRRQEADLASRYGELHPKMVNAKAQSRDLQNKIAEEVKKIVQGLANEVDIARAKETQLAKDLQDLETRAGVEMKDSVTLRQLEREAEANRTLYENFLTRFKETSEQADLRIADSRVIARAEAPIQPAFPRKSLFLIIGLALGGVLGALLAYLIEYFDRGFRNAAQIEAATGLPVVGLVPALTGEAPITYVLEKPLSAYSEALRTVRTAVHFSNVDQPPKTVMVTSAAPEEGKTTFCLSLARSLAKAGNKILLIDADMRRPRVAQVAGLENAQHGLTALLSGEKSFAEVTRPDPSVSGLDLVPSVGKAPNAQDLLGSHQMENLLREAAQHYDLVIVDTPPVLAVSDALMAARAVDTTLFIVRWAVTPRETTTQAVRQLRQSGCKIAGVVMTQVNTQEHVRYGEEGYAYSYREYYAN